MNQSAFAVHEFFADVGKKLSVRFGIQPVNVGPINTKGVILHKEVGLLPSAIPFTKILQMKANRDGQGSVISDVAANFALAIAIDGWARWGESSRMFYSRNGCVMLITTNRAFPAS